MKNKKVYLSLIVILAFILRFYKLGKNPPSLNLDEVAIGYNAYSILKTGKDEYGDKLPLAFRSHDDYKPPLYIYLTVPSIATFGLNEIAVRFPSALLGALTIPLTYFLVVTLFPQGKKINSEKVALFAALLLSINPWHLQFSRAGFETNVAVFFTVLGVLTFFKGIEHNSKWWYFTSLNFALTLYTYQTARLFIPLFSLFILLLFYKEIINKSKKNLIASVVLFVFLVIPLVPVMTSTAGVMRFKGTSVFEHPGLIDEEFERIQIDAQNQNQYAIKIIHNRRIVAFLTVIEGYLKHFRPDVIFLGRKGPPYNYTPNIGLFYLFELPFIIWGFHVLFKQKEKSRFLIALWLILSPLASAFTWDIPSSTRMTIALPTFQIIAAFGLYDFYGTNLSNRQLSRIARIIISILFIFNFNYYLHQYYTHAPIEYGKAWQYGYKQAVEYSEANIDKYNRILVSTDLKQPQNFFAFYSKYDPWIYINIDGGTVSGGFLENKNKFGKYTFHIIDYPSLKTDDNLLLVDLYENLPGEFQDKVLKTIYSLNGDPFLVIARI